MEPHSLFCSPCRFRFCTVGRPGRQPRPMDRWITALAARSVGRPRCCPTPEVDSRTDSRTGSPGNRAPNGFEASRTTCYKDGEVVDRAYCQSDSFYQPNRIPQTDVFAQRCSNNNPNFNPADQFLHRIGWNSAPMLLTGALAVTAVRCLTP